jgi:hypothetical protein
MYQNNHIFLYINLHLLIVYDILFKDKTAFKSVTSLKCPAVLCCQFPCYNKQN